MMLSQKSGRAKRLRKKFKKKSMAKKLKKLSPGKRAILDSVNANRKKRGLKPMIY